MKPWLLIFGGIGIGVILVVALWIIVPLVMVANNSSEWTSEPIATEDVASAKTQVLEICNEFMRRIAPDPTKSDQVKFACGCVWGRVETIAPGKTRAEVMNILLAPSGNSPDTITQCAVEVGLLKLQ